MILDFLNIQNPWWISGIAFLIILIAYISGVILTRLLSKFMERTHIDEKIANIFGQEYPQSMNRVASRITRFFITLIGVYYAWNIVHTIPYVKENSDRILEFIHNAKSYPVVILIYDFILVILFTFILVKVFGWVSQGFEKIENTIKEEHGKKIKGFSLQSLEILSAEQIKSILLTINRYLRYAINIIVVLLYIGFIFSIFPQTRGWTNSVIQSVLQALLRGWNSIIAYLPNLINLVIIIIISRYALKFIHFIFHEIEKGTITLSGFKPEWSETTFQLVRVVVIALTLIISFPYLPGSASPAFQGVSIFIGFLFSLGSTSIVANIVAGIVMTYTGAFNVGDRVTIASTTGDVTEKTMLVTRIRTIKNVEITIPNSMVLSSHIINYSTKAEEQGLILHSTVTLGYDLPWRKVHEVLISAALDTEGIIPEPPPFVLQTSLNDFYVSYEINAYTRSPLLMANIYSDLHQSIQDKCNQAGIEILSPHYSSLRDGNMSTIPEDYLPKNYKAPKFRLDNK